MRTRRPDRRVLAAALLAVSLAPPLFPRPPWVQALESLLLAGAGWWAGRPSLVRRPWAAALLGVVLAACLAWQALLWTRAGAGLPAGFVPLAVLLVGAGVLLLYGPPSSGRTMRVALEVVVAALVAAVTVAAIPTVPSAPTVPSIPIGRPVHVAVPVEADPDAGRRADRGVGELVGAGGLARATLVVLVPTGSGWVDGAALATLDAATGGDVATVAVGYDDAPSWLSYATARDEAVATTRAVLERVRQAAGSQRRVLVYGQSLGALAGAGALRPGLADGALWVGPPPGTPRTPGAVVLTHASDPVPTWSPALLWRPPPPATDADLPRPPWLPVVSFLQTSVDLLVALSAPPGHGHRYGDEHAVAWAALLGQRSSSMRELPRVLGFT